MHHPQEDLVAGGTAGDHAGSVVKDPNPGHGPGPPAVAAARHGGGDVGAEDVVERAGECVAVGPHHRAGHSCPLQAPLGPNRSVLIRSGAYPWSTSRLATASAN